MHDVAAIGELLIDFVEQEADALGYPTLKAQPGGAPANFLAALNAYGYSTALIGKVGDDTFGHLLCKTLQEAGIDVSGMVLDRSVYTTLAFVTLDETGDREFSFARKPGADTCLHADEIDFSLIDDAKVMHFGSLSLTDQPARSATQQAVAHARAHGKLISFDPNLRLPLWANTEDAAKQMKWGFHQADIVKISDEEVEFLWDCSLDEAIDKLLKEFQTRLVYVTLGSEGCLIANEHGSVRIPSPEVHVIDTTGAGDIFGGSAMSQFLRKGKEPEDLTIDDLTDIGNFACYAASLSTEAHGGITSIVPEATVKEAIAHAAQALS